MSATNSNSFLARLSIIKRLWLAFGLLVVLLVAGFRVWGIQPPLDVRPMSPTCRSSPTTAGWPRRSRARSSISGSTRGIMSSPETRRSSRCSANASGNSPTGSPRRRPGSPIPPASAGDGDRKPHLHLLRQPGQDHRSADAAGRRAPRGWSPRRNGSSDRFTEIKDASAADGVPRRRSRPARPRSTGCWSRLFVDRFLTSGDSAAKALVDANIGGDCATILTSLTAP